MTASRTTLVPSGDDVRVVRETEDAARVRTIRASLVVARQDPTPAQATAALTRLATYFSAPRRSPSVDSGAGSESVEEVKKKRKPVETPEALRHQLERERATEQAMKEQQKAARDQRSALRAAARAEALAQQEAAERRSPIGRVVRVAEGLQFVLTPHLLHPDHQSGGIRSAIGSQPWWIPPAQSLQPCTWPGGPEREQTHRPDWTTWLRSSGGGVTKLRARVKNRVEKCVHKVTLV